VKRALEAAGLAALAGLVLAAGGGVITAKHAQRQLNARLAELSRERDALDGEWTRLLLEQATLSTHTRIDAAARRELGMLEPGPDQVAAVAP
jgi:cell division protein FtsL